ncbi:MAG: hypothetical protein IT425_02195 [Pirellulales bacterium]|nr:hypothetical protein [Pirellulales bacterium]
MLSCKPRLNATAMNLPTSPLKNAIVAFFNLAKLGRAPRAAWSAPRGPQISDFTSLI